MKFVHTMTGASFLVLGVSVLKYGSQLETSVTHSINIRSTISESLEGLDVRILTITIMLSLVFLCRTLLDFMFAFSLLQSDLNNTHNNDHAEPGFPLQDSARFHVRLQPVTKR